jgi:hypothetical protein
MAVTRLHLSKSLRINVGVLKAISCAPAAGVPGPSLPQQHDAGSALDATPAGSGSEEEAAEVMDELLAAKLAAAQQARGVPCQNCFGKCLQPSLLSPAVGLSSAGAAVRAFFRGIMLRVQASCPGSLQEQR